MINIQFKKFGLENNPNAQYLNGNLEFSNETITIVYLDKKTYDFSGLLDAKNTNNFRGDLLINKSPFDRVLLESNGESSRDLIDFITNNTVLVSNLNVLENVELAIKGGNTKDPILSLKQFDLLHLSDAFPSALSKGERIIISVIMALVRSCELLVLDCLLDDLIEQEFALVAAVLQKCRDYFNKRIVVLTQLEKLNISSSNVYILKNGDIEKSFHSKFYEKEVTI